MNLFIHHRANHVVTDDQCTAGVLRALERARRSALATGCPAVAPVHLLAALAMEEESRAADLLAKHGLTSAALIAHLDQGRSSNAPPPPDVEAADVPFDPESRAILSDALHRSRAHDRNRQVSSEQLLSALLDSPAGFGPRLAGQGLDVASLLEEIVRDDVALAEPIPLAEEFSRLELVSPAEMVDLGRVLDASANRAREGLRVVEDYVRFALDDAMLTRRLKEVRHRLDQAIRGFDPGLPDRLSRHPGRRRNPHHDGRRDRPREPPRRARREFQEDVRGTPFA